MLKTILVSVVIVLLHGCGGGDDSNASSFPNVAGRYSFNTGNFDVSCSDGSKTTNPALALNFDVVQNVNVITLVNANAPVNVPGITVVDSTNATGNVETDSSFIVTQITTATIDGISGTVTLTYNIEGVFNTNGWSGTYTYFAASPGLGGTCSFKAPFSGTKIASSRISPSSQELRKFEGLTVDFYDSFSILGSLVATNK